MDIQEEVRQIQDRNKRVEADKAWEVSLFRHLVVFVLTYATAFLFLYIVDAKNAWMAAFVPAVAFFISTATIGPLKNWWIKKFYK